MENFYNQRALELDAQANFGRKFQRCAISVMDTIADPDITFDENGICNYYYYYKDLEAREVRSGKSGEAQLASIVEKIKKEAGNNKYDSILGLSGGADSTYMAYMAKELGLNPLLVHFDYGWNLETAVQNIERTVKVLEYDLYTYVMDWEEFKDLLRAYIKASVLDLDVPADHLIFASLSKVAKQQNIKYILKGYNVSTEAILPRTWNYNRKFDLINLESIHKRFGEKPLKTIPKLGITQQLYYRHIVKLRDISPLNYIDYNKNKAKQLLSEKLGWVDYGGKHCENIFTRFYQGYILPKKFNIDKRKAHFSTLIFSGQMTREEALKELSNPAYDLQSIMEDKEYIAKKLNFSLEEIDFYLNQPNRSHDEFGDETRKERIFNKFIKTAVKIKNIFK